MRPLGPFNNGCQAKRVSGREASLEFAAAGVEQEAVSVSIEGNRPRLEHRARWCLHGRAKEGRIADEHYRLCRARHRRVNQGAIQ